MSSVIKNAAICYIHIIFSTLLLVMENGSAEYV